MPLSMEWILGERNEMDKKVITVCYGKKDEWNSRKEAEAFFLEAMMGSDGSERDRYTNIYIKLQMGMEFCTDDEY